MKLSLKQNLLSEQHIVALGQSTARLHVCTDPSGLWTLARQGFPGGPSALQLPVASPLWHPQCHTHTLCHVDKQASSKVPVPGSPGFLWVGASLSLSLTSHGLPEPLSFTGQAPASFTHFCYVLLSLAIPAPLDVTFMLKKPFIHVRAAALCDYAKQKRAGREQRCLCKSWCTGSWAQGTLWCRKTTCRSTGQQIGGKHLSKMENSLADQTLDNKHWIWILK